MLQKRIQLHSSSRQQQWQGLQVAAQLRTALLQWWREACVHPCPTALGGGSKAWYYGGPMPATMEGQQRTLK